MSRVRKLFIVSVVLGIGVTLAWPYRKQPAKQDLEQRAPASADVLTLHKPVLSPVVTEPPAERPVKAHMASTAEDSGFDLANHPALSASQKPPAAPPVEREPVEAASEEQGVVEADPSVAPTQSRPAYTTTLESAVRHNAASWPEEAIHVVQNGDTLEKLAKRYLGDAGRALELFDLNRDQLSNPHLLPIGSELRIPIQPKQTID